MGRLLDVASSTEPLLAPPCPAQHLWSTHSTPRARLLQHVHCPSTLPLTTWCLCLKSQSHVFHIPSSPSAWHGTTPVWRKLHVIFIKGRLRETQYTKQSTKKGILKYPTDKVHFPRSILETIKEGDYHGMGVS